MAANPAAHLEQRLQPSPGFALQFDYVGTPYLSSLTAPYHRATPLTEAHRALLACFQGKGTSVREAATGFLRWQGLEASASNLRDVAKMTAALRDVGALEVPSESNAYYTAEMVGDYVAERTLPKPVVDWVVRSGRIQRSSRVLDLGSGTGALAHRLAAVSDHVTGMDVCLPFVEAAREEARRLGLRARYLHESANRLAFHRERYDAVTISLAFHWLDPFLATEGILHVLERQGRFIVLEGAPRLPPRHPLRNLLPKQPALSPSKFRAYYDGLFRAAQRPGQGRPHLEVSSTFRYDERRTLGIPYARAFMAPEILREAGVKEWKTPSKFWRKLEREMGALPERAFAGRFEWLGLALRFVKD